MTDYDHELSVHGAGNVTRERPGPAPAINIGDNGPVSQESREQDKYFENQATKTNVTNLVAAREIHSVEIFVFHSYTNRQRVNECAELPFVLQYYIFDL